MEKVAVIIVNMIAGFKKLPRMVDHESNNEVETL